MHACRIQSTPETGPIRVFSWKVSLLVWATFDARVLDELLLPILCDESREESLEEEESCVLMVQDIRDKSSTGAANAAVLESPCGVVRTFLARCCDRTLLRRFVQALIARRPDAFTRAVGTDPTAIHAIARALSPSVPPRGTAAPSASLRSLTCSQLTSDINSIIRREREQMLTDDTRAFQARLDAALQEGRRVPMNAQASPHLVAELRDVVFMARFRPYIARVRQAEQASVPLLAVMPVYISLSRNTTRPNAARHD